MNSKIFWVALLAIMILTMVGCDPTKDEFSKAQHFDFGRINPKILSVSVQQFVGDDEFTKDRAGQTYYQTRIEYEKDGKQVTEYLRGIPDFIYDKLVNLVGKHYSESRFLTMEDFKRMEGRVVYRYINPSSGDWMVVFHDGRNYKIYPVTLETFIKSRSQSLLAPLG